jgi:ACT domain-containing protein
VDALSNSKSYKIKNQTITLIDVNGSDTIILTRTINPNRISISDVIAKITNITKNITNIIKTITTPSNTTNTTTTI